MLPEKTRMGRGSRGLEQGGTFTVHRLGETLNIRWQVKRQSQQLLTVYSGPLRGRVLHRIHDSLQRNDGSFSELTDKNTKGHAGRLLSVPCRGRRGTLGGRLLSWLRGSTVPCRGGRGDIGGRGRLLSWFRGSTVPCRGRRGT